MSFPSHRNYWYYLCYSKSMPGINMLINLGLARSYSCHCACRGSCMLPWSYYTSMIHRWFYSRATLQISPLRTTKGLTDRIVTWSCDACEPMRVPDSNFRYDDVFLQTAWKWATKLHLPSLGGADFKTLMTSRAWPLLQWLDYQHGGPAHVSHLSR
jgi:hypothetical protein